MATTMRATAEYSQVKAHEWAEKRTLDERAAHGQRYWLEYRGAGYMPAGSAARFQETEAWYVLFMCDGAVNGRGFKTEAEARGLFDKWTAPR